jgi:hypothetical protein
MRTGIKSNGDYADLNMSIEGVDTFCFFFVLCAAARGCDIHAHSKETEQGCMPYRTVGALPGQGWWQRQCRLRVSPRVYQQFFSVSKGDIITKLSEPCLYFLKENLDAERGCGKGA